MTEETGKLKPGMAREVLQEFAREMVRSHEQVASNLVVSTKAMALELAAYNEKVAERLVLDNKALAENLAESNRLIAAKLVTSTQLVASKLSAENREIASQVEAMTINRFEKQKNWNWSLILINSFICVILLFFGFAGLAAFLR